MPFDYSHLVEQLEITLAVVELIAHIDLIFAVHVFLSDFVEYFFEPDVCIFVVRGNNLLLDHFFAVENCVVE